MTLYGSDEIVVLEDRVWLDQTHVASAMIATHTRFVYLHFTERGSELLLELTENNLGRRLGILVAGMLMAAPEIKDVNSTGTIAFEVQSYRHADSLAGCLNDYIRQRDAGKRLAGRITEYPLPTPGSNPHQAAVDPQGRVWYTGVNANAIGRFDPETETFREFPLRTRDAGPHGLTSDARGRIWFTHNHRSRIGRRDPETGRIREYVAPGVRDPHTLVFGADGRLWFTAQHSNKVVRFNVRNFNMKVRTAPTPEAQPYDIVPGPDGNMWFCELAAGRIASIEPQTGTFAEYPTPTPNSGPRRLAADGDSIWVTLNYAGKLARFNVRTKEWKEWPSPSGPDSRPYGIAIARSGAVWYNEAAADKMVRFDPVTEEFETFPMPSPDSVVRHITRDANGTLWLTVGDLRAAGNNQLARID
jgi:streptogramin lyase